MVRFALLALVGTTGSLSMTLSAAAQTGAQPTDLSRRTLRLEAPTRMVAGMTNTIKAEVLDPTGRIDWRIWSALAQVSARRADTQAPVPISTVVFDTHDGAPTADSLRFYNGVGSVSFTLDQWTEQENADIIVTVSLGPISASRTVTVLGAAQERRLSGSLTGANLLWGPGDGVIRITGNTSVAAGRVLTIQPGTMVMVDPGVAGEGTRITVYGEVHASGTAAQPIHFFSSAGAPSMHLTTDCTNEPVWNIHDWRGFVHYGDGTSTYEHVFLTGAGNAPVSGHTRAPIMNFTQAHSFDMLNCVLADNNGKAVYGTGSGQYRIEDTLITRCGHGAEFTESGAYSLLVNRCWFTGIGHAPERCNRDGDPLNIRARLQDGQGPKVVQESVFADTGDDGIDHMGSFFSVENCLIYDVRGSAITLERDTGGAASLTNTLIFGCAKGIDAELVPVTLHQCTIANPYPLRNAGAGSQVSECILWGSSVNACNGSVSQCILGAGSTLSCGAGNMIEDPDFVDPSSFNFDLRPDSPALTQSGRIGWLGSLDESATGQGGGGAASRPNRFILAFKQDCSLPVIGAIANEDIALFDPAVEGGFSLLFDGSDVGLSRVAIDALAVLPTGEILLSFVQDGTIPGLIGGPDGTLVDDADIVKFTPSSLGANTAGQLTFYFDGSDVGFDPANGSEDIDSLSVDAAGRLYISTLGTNNASGANTPDEDVLIFTPSSTGAGTAGQWSAFFDGSDVGLGTDERGDIAGASLLPDGRLGLCLFGLMTLGDIQANEHDLLKFAIQSSGVETAGQFTLDSALEGIGGDTASAIAAVESVPGE